MAADAATPSAAMRRRRPPVLSVMDRSLLLPCVSSVVGAHPVVVDRPGGRQGAVGKMTARTS
jgi:hypothetical protein